MVLFLLIVVYLVLMALSYRQAVKHEKGRKELIAILAEQRAKMEEQAEQRKVLMEALVTSNRRQELEKWNARLLRQDIKDLVKSKGGTWE